MKISIRFFAGHRERVGADRIELDVPQGATVRDAFAIIARLYPAVGDTESFTKFARNRRMVDPGEELSDGDELALLQPVSGGAAGPTVKVTGEQLSIDDCVRAVESPDCGGIAVFLGAVRDNSEGKSTDHLEYEAYIEMAEDVIREIASEAAGRWEIGRIAVQHRTGELRIGEISVIVAVSAPHRADALDACRYIIDELKTRAPIWKKEFGEDGEMWVGGPEGAR